MSTNKERLLVTVTTVLAVLVPEDADAAARSAAITTAVFESEQAINQMTRYRAHSTQGCDGWVIPFTVGYDSLRGLSADALDGLLADTDTETEADRLRRRQIEWALSCHGPAASGG